VPDAISEKLFFGAAITQEKPSRLSVAGLVFHSAQTKQSAELLAS
jgi:hypothetical protein